MEQFRIAHADGGHTRIEPMNKSTWRWQRHEPKGSRTSSGSNSGPPEQMLRLLRAEDLTPFGEYCTRIANPDVPTVSMISASFGAELMRREYEKANGIAGQLNSIAHAAELADATLEIINDRLTAVEAAEQASSDTAEVTALPLPRRVVDVLRACGEPRSLAELADDLGADTAEIADAIGPLIPGGIILASDQERPRFYQIAPGWR